MGDKIIHARMYKVGLRDNQYLKQWKDYLETKVSDTPQKPAEIEHADENQYNHSRDINTLDKNLHILVKRETDLNQVIANKPSLKEQPSVTNPTLENNTGNKSKLSLLDSFADPST